MQNKPNVKNRDDIKVIFTTVALTMTLAFWNLFSNGTQNSIQAVSPGPGIAQVAQVAQVKILLGGPAPKTTIFVTQPVAAQPRSPQPAAAQPRSQRHAPQPVANTGSSK